MPEHKVVNAVRVTIGVAALLMLSVPAMAATQVVPPNDNFTNASLINVNALPFSAVVDISEATNESGEPFYCAFSNQTIWYKLTPTTSVWFGADISGSSFFGGALSVYRDTGSGIFGLASIVCVYAYSDSGIATFQALAGTTYYLQVLAPCCDVRGTVHVNLRQVPAPQPVAQFYFNPSDPSVLDNVQFNDQSYDPGQSQIQTEAWNFGDGATATGCCPTHRYAADGSYTVRLAIATVDGRTAETTRIVTVRTHDIGITKFQTPQSGSEGQTRQITVGIRNSKYPERVRVELFRGIAGPYYAFESIGTSYQFVPVRPSNRTTDFSFSYTFTGDDALFGKVTFRAVASLDTARDAWVADNEAISLPTKVSGGVALQSFGNPEPSSPVAEARFALLGVKPNPMVGGGDVVVQLSLAEGATAAVQVLDIAGRVMAERDLGSLGAGTHEARIAWQHRPAPGIYWVRLTQAGNSASKRIGVLP